MPGEEKVLAPHFRRKLMPPKKLIFRPPCFPEKCVLQLFLFRMGSAKRRRGRGVHVEQVVRSTSVER